MQSEFKMKQSERDWLYLIDVAMMGPADLQWAVCWWQAVRWPRRGRATDCGGGGGYGSLETLSSRYGVLIWPRWWQKGPMTISGGCLTIFQSKLQIYLVFAQHSLESGYRHCDFPACTFLNGSQRCVDNWLKALLLLEWLLLYVKWKQSAW